jgi:hypothetical protein
MLKKILASIIVITICLSTKAQEARLPLQSYFFLGLSAPIFKIKDKAHSPLTYTGVSGNLRLGYEQYKADFISRQYISFSFGNGMPKIKPKPSQMLSQLDLTGFELVFQYYHRLNTFDTEGWNRYFGGGFNLYFDIRNYNLPSNNLLGYQANTSLNAGLLTHKKLNEVWHFEYELFTPILSYTLRTNYNGMLPVKGNDFAVKNVLKTGDIVTINKFFRLYNRFSANQLIKEYRQRRISYFWDYLSNKSSQDLKSVTAGISYEALFKM